MADFEEDFALHITHPCMLGMYADCWEVKIGSDPTLCKTLTN
jgi:hypothetical protein